MTDQVNQQAAAVILEAWSRDEPVFHLVMDKTGMTLDQLLLYRITQMTATTMQRSPRQ